MPVEVTMKSQSKTEIDLGMPVHPLADLMPWIEGEEWIAFKESIAEDGVRDPIVVHEGVLIDGRKRLRACRELGVKPRFIPLSELIQPEDDGTYAIDGFIFARNLYRLHLDGSQRAAVVVSWDSMQRTISDAQHAKQENLVPGAIHKKDADEIPKKADSFDVSKPTHRRNQQERTHEKIMELAHVGQHTARNALIVAKHAPELLPEVIEGSLPLATAAKTAKEKRAEKVKPTVRRKTKSAREFDESMLDAMVTKTVCSLNEIVAQIPKHWRARWADRLLDFLTEQHNVKA